MKVTFLTAGGTIDKDYATTAGTYDFHIGEPVIERILDGVNPAFDYEVISVLKKDSLDMDDKDRKKIFEVCNKISDRRIVITHGTDTMQKTAKVLSGIKNKVIILTGSSTPEVFKNSNARFNVGFAVSAVQTLESGVYICMNGRIFDWNKVEKNFEGRFVEL